MEAAAGAVIERLESAPELWDRAPPGRWSAGQHVEHLANVHALIAEALERAQRDLEAGTLLPPRARGVLQKMFVTIMTRSRKFPRGGRAPRSVAPRPDPIRPTTLARLGVEVARYRALVERLSAPQRERLWIRNPFVPFDWHYRLSEVLRIQAQHTRHHLMLVEEIASRLGPRGASPGERRGWRR